MNFSEWIPDSFFSGILDCSAQYSAFQKQKFPGLRNPNYLIFLHGSRRGQHLFSGKLTDLITDLNPLTPRVKQSCLTPFLFYAQEM